MATDTATSVSGGLVNFSTGSYTSDNTACIVTLGFTARRVEAINSTDTIVWTKVEGMAAANCVKVTGTTQTIETSGDILINTDGTITLSATLSGNSKAITWAAWG